MLLSEQSFDRVVKLFAAESGIVLGPNKRALVSGRLQRLAQEHGERDLDAYVNRLMQGNDPVELVRAVDKLTTNETYFFREPQHFEALADLATQRRGLSRDFRVWSAASSSGEEAYSAAMVLADTFGASGWEVMGTDLSTAMVDTARRALYPLERARNVPMPLLKAWCLKGHSEYEGQLRVTQVLRDRTHFQVANLMRELPAIGEFDVVFLRNVLIYFDNPAKREIIQRVLRHVRPDGLLFVGHAESVATLGLPLRTLAPAIYAHE